MLLGHLLREIVNCENLSGVFMLEKEWKRCMHVWDVLSQLGRPEFSIPCPQDHFPGPCKNTWRDITTGHLELICLIRVAEGGWVFSPRSYDLEWIGKGSFWNDLCLDRADDNNLATFLLERRVPRWCLCLGGVLFLWVTIQWRGNAESTWDGGAVKHRIFLIDQTVKPWHLLLDV